MCGLAGGWRTWEKKIVKLRDKKSWCRGLWMDVKEWMQHGKLFVSHVKPICKYLFPKMCQEDKITWPAFSEPLSHHCWMMGTEYSYCHCQMSNLLAIKTEAKFYSLRKPMGYLVTSWLHCDLFFSGRTRGLLSQEQTLIPGMGVAIPACRTSVVPLSGCLIHRHGIPHNTVSDQKTLFITRSRRRGLWTWDLRVTSLCNLKAAGYASNIGIAS